MNYKFMSNIKELSIPLDIFILMLHNILKMYPIQPPHRIRKIGMQP